MNTDNFIIDNSDIELAQNICKMIADDNVRNRAVANAIAANIAVKYFDLSSSEVDTESGLHNIGLVLEDIDISDIYIKNNYIDVRVFFNEEEISVPEAHFQNNLLPTAYMFIKISADLSGASVIGFISPENINRDSSINGHYRVLEDELVSFYDIEPLIVSIDEEPEISDKDIFAFIDGNLADKNSFYADLIKSKEGRLKLAKAAKAKEIFKFVSVVKSEEPKIDNTIEIEPEFEAFEEDLLIEDNDSLELDISEGEDLLAEEEPDEIEELTDFDSEEEDLLEENDTVDELMEIDSSIEEEDDLNQEVDEVEIPESLSLNADEIVLEEREKETFEIEEFKQEPEELTFIDSDITEEEESSEIINNDEITALEIEEEPNTEQAEPVAEEEEKEEEFDYSTVSSHDDAENILDELSDEPETDNTETEVEEQSASNEQIDTLFNENNESMEETPNIETYSPKKQKNSMLPVAVLAMIIIAGALGYYGYNKFVQLPANDEIISNDLSSGIQTSGIQKEDAMPIESVETTAPQLSNEGTSDTIPMIEQNLDASILVSNLKVEWEIPAGYASNTAARRYLVKIGKIIQLNLKTELLLLNKPPITNKIAVEIKYNNQSKKFETAGITISSGEKSVDDLIQQAVDKALSMNLSTNTDSFAKLQGNPVLVIHL